MFCRLEDCSSSYSSQA